MTGYKDIQWKLQLSRRKSCYVEKNQNTLSVYKQHDNQNYLVHLTDRTMYPACFFLAN